MKTTQICRKSPNKVLCQKPETSIGPLQKLVQDYLRNCGNMYVEEDRWWAEEAIGWEMVLSRAWLSRMPRLHDYDNPDLVKLKKGLKHSRSSGYVPQDFQTVEDVQTWVKDICKQVGEYPDEPLRISNVIDRLSIRLGLKQAQSQIWWKSERLTWSEALEGCWLGDFLRMHGHQCYVSAKLPIGLEKARGKNPPKTFDELYGWVKGITHEVKGLGPLTAYDVARRLGSWLTLEPNKVYLHAGSMHGAKALITNIDLHNGAVPINKFPEELQGLSAIHIENFLCIYKKELQSLSLV